jgi:hypothetical protein
VNVVQNQHRVSAGVVLNKVFHGRSNTTGHFWPAFIIVLLSSTVTIRTLLDFYICTYGKTVECFLWAKILIRWAEAWLTIIQFCKNICSHYHNQVCFLDRVPYGTKPFSYKHVTYRTGYWDCGFGPVQKGEMAHKTEKSEKKTYFEMLDVLFWELKASPAAWMSFEEA